MYIIKDKITEKYLSCPMTEIPNGNLIKAIQSGPLLFQKDSTAACRYMLKSDAHKDIENYSILKDRAVEIVQAN